MSRKKGRTAEEGTEPVEPAAREPDPLPPDLPPPDPPQPNLPFLLVAGVLYAGWVAFLYWMAATG